jgi:hypothetical protein
MRLLVACEFSGVVREAFRRIGHDAWSCDLLEAEDSSPFHIQGDAIEIMQPAFGWDLMIAFPPCTHLAVSAARWFSDRLELQEESLQFVDALLNAPVERIALENPIGVISTRIRKPDQIIQPWQFGHPETKATCLWLKNLPLLKSSCIVEGRYPRVHRESPGPDRWKRRSRTLSGIAAAMADQWGSALNYSMPSQLELTL